MKKVIGDIPIESFHITDWLRAHGLQKLIGKKKSLSTFTALKRDAMQTTGAGIQTSGGIVFHLEGKLLAGGLADIGSVPDLQGRRWFHPSTLADIVGWKGKNLSKLKKRWSPYNSIATWYLWRSLDPIAINY